MSTPAVLASYAAGLLLALGGGWALGAAVPPVLDEPAPAHDAPHQDDTHEGDRG
ncbi:hypothetical protein [Nocardioides perillae]|uniref:Uncharacterized protein n=1 Tax=Nocardioides perillae TaxID=1119534 RepID=A0A7Y9RR25_9ACTN|nr:hypothetical protein [Nocardioides perillae]NYG54760.1 hypothetical protein [Nocardioides perillae]